MGQSGERQRVCSPTKTKVGVDPAGRPFRKCPLMNEEGRRGRADGRGGDDRTISLVTPMALPRYEAGVNGLWAPLYRDGLLDWKEGLLYGKEREEGLPNRKDGVLTQRST
ncbi:hypothetical protein Pcinc_003864 [Petrolisthes cinctipes]|uniref:Uncharacterized protein n=1 Tax=Petrolisthes cinctipes TaxID=88211 RepID=A0AAE1GFH5_PETCI|nr:hypothetical protein Pcinc_003864 [Petrolisthes cinctipes]